MSTNNVSPQSFLGGTWQAWGAGRVPVSVNTSDADFNAANKTGGAKTVTLTSGQLPNLVGSMQASVPDGFAASGIIKGKSWTATKNDTATKSTKNTVYGFEINFGEGKAHQNMPPYITCYMWRRTA